MTLNRMYPTLRAFAAPLTTPLVLFTAVVTAALLLAAQAGLPGLPLALLALYATASYALVLIEYAAHGRELPVLSIEMINPAHHPRPFGALVLVAGGAWAVSATSGEFGAAAGVGVAALTVAVLPAMIALLCIDDTWFASVSPLHVTRLVRGLGLRYGAYLAIAAAYLYAARWLATHAPVPVALALALLLALSLSTGLGGLLYARRTETGIDAWVAPEQTAAKAARLDDREREQVVHEMYGLVRGANAEAAWACAHKWLSRRGMQPADLVWLRDRVANWDDRRVADRLTRELVLQHLRRADHAAALATLDAWFAVGGDYHPGSGRELGRLIGLSRLDGRTGLADRLLAECGPAYASDPEISSLLARRERERGGG